MPLVLCNYFLRVSGNPEVCLNEQNWHYNDKTVDYVLSSGLQFFERKRYDKTIAFSVLRTLQIPFVLLCFLPISHNEGKHLAGVKYQL